MEVSVNWLAVLVAGVVGYFVAFLWYGIAFSKLWAKLTGISEMKPKAFQVALVLAGSILMSYVLAHALVFGNAYLHTGGVAGGLMVGFFNWLGFIAPVSLTAVVYEKRPWKLWALDNSYWL